MDDLSREALLAFHDYLSTKGLMARNTAQSRKAAVSKVLSILEPDEAADVTKIDVDDVIARFSRLHGHDYTPESLTTYKSRLRSALHDFRAYRQNPLAFRPAVQTRERRKPAAKSEAQATTRPAAEPVRAAPAMATSGIMPIQIRENLTVYIQGLPFDLTRVEADKLVGVINALALPAA